MEYEPIIGLETHVQLKTQSKMWCGCANQYGAEPNTQVCPVCLGMPGVLPVPNEEALRLTALTGYLLHCELPGHVEFDRKITSIRMWPRITSSPSWLILPLSTATWTLR